MTSYVYRGRSYRYLTVLVRKNYCTNEWETYSLYRRSWQVMNFINFIASLTEFTEDDIKNYYGWHGKTIEVMSSVAAVAP